MAPDEEKTTVEGGEESSSSEAKPKKGGNKMILFGGIGLGVIVIGVLLAIFVVQPMMSESSSTSGDSSEISKSGENGKSEKAKEKKKKKKKKSSGEEGEASESLVYSIKDIVINPAGTGGSRFLSVSFGFDLGSSEMVQEFEEREMLVRDALITILSSKTVAQLTDPKQKEILRYQIKKRVSGLLDTDELYGVYYTDFVLQ